MSKILVKKAGTLGAGEFNREASNKVEETVEGGYDNLLPEYYYFYKCASV